MCHATSGLRYSIVDDAKLKFWRTFSPRTESRLVALKLGFTSGQIVQEIGWPDPEIYSAQEIENIRLLVEKETGTELLEEDSNEICDGVLLWWTAQDGEAEELGYALVDAASLLEDKGQVLLVVPAKGQEDYVDPRDIEDAARESALHPSNTLAIGKWLGCRLIVSGQRR